MVNALEHPGAEINSEERKIYWLASYPKSGNTWVRMFMNCFATRFPIKLNSAYQFITSDLRPEIFQMMQPRPLSEMSFREQFMYHQGALLNLLKLANTKHIYVKTHNAKAIIDGVHLIPPAISAKAVYIIRDPRDVVISSAKHFKQTIDEAITHMANPDRAGKANFNLYHLFMSWSSHVESWGSKNKSIDTLFIRYEDLLTNPIEAFKKIIEQFDLEDIDDFEQRFEFALEQSNFSNLQKAEKEGGFVEKAGGDLFFRVGQSGQWKTVLTGKQIKLIEEQHKQVMEHYGYI
jgi:hypothetical protein